MHSWFAILTTLFVALVLTLLPMPEWIIWWRPAWVLMVLIYWAMVAPNQIGVGAAWLVGIVVDLLSGTLLGEHALAYSVVIYFVWRLHLRLRVSPKLQQSMSVFVFILLYQFILYCIQGFIEALPVSHLYWMSSLTSMLLWPWVFILMRDHQKRVKI